MSIISRKEQKGSLYLAGVDADISLASDGALIYKWRIENVASCVLGKNTRIELYQIMANLVGVSNAYIEIYAPHFSQNDIDYSSSNTNNDPFIGVFQATTKIPFILNDKVSFKANNVLHNGYFVIKIYFKDATFTNIDGLIDDWNKYILLRFNIFEEVLDHRIDTAQSTQNDIIIGKMQDNLKLK